MSLESSFEIRQPARASTHYYALLVFALAWQTWTQSPCHSGSFPAGLLHPTASLKPCAANDLPFHSPCCAASLLNLLCSCDLACSNSYQNGALRSMIGRVAVGPLGQFGLPSYL